MSLKTTYTSTELTPFYVGGALATLSLDGNLLATAVVEDIVITDLDTNTILHRIEGDGEVITCMQITPDGSYLGVVSQSQQLRIFSVASGECVKAHRLPSPAYVCAADSTSTLFALGCSDGSVIVYDIENGFVTHSLKGHGTTVSALCFYGVLNSSKWILASGDTHGLIKIWDLVKRKAIATLDEHTNAVRGLAFQDGVMISGGRDDVVISWDMQRWKTKKTLSTQQQVEAVGFIGESDENLIYTAGGDGIMKVWDLSTGKVITTTKQPLEELLVIGVLPTDHQTKFVVYSDQTLVEIDTTGVEEDMEIPIERTIAGNHGTIADMKYCGPHRSLLALATNSPALRIVDPINTPLDVSILEGHTDLLNAVDASLDGLWIATAGKDNEARLWHWNEDEGEFEIYAVFQGHSASVSAVSIQRTFEGTPKFILTASSDLTVKKWKVPKQKESDELPYMIKTSDYTRRAHDKDINGLDISPNDQFFATASYDKTAKVWDLESGEVVGLLKGHKRGLWDVRFSVYDKSLITSSGDKTLKQWSLTDFSCMKTFEGHTNAVQRAEFLNGEKQVISTGADGLVKIWDISTGECIQTLDKHANRIWALVTKENGAEFVTADADGVFQLWVDNTEEVNRREEEAAKLRVEQEQSLQNYIQAGKWGEAFLLALTLDQPMRLYNVLKSSIASCPEGDESILGEELDAMIKTLNDDQILLLFKRARTWNVNARFFQVAQKLISALLQTFDAERLIEIPGLMQYVDSLVPYNERHYARVDGLIEQSFILDYSLEEMAKVV